MKEKKNTRRALMLSILSLILCCAMLAGTTLAWFTDEVTSSNNVISTGTLDVSLEASQTGADDSWSDASSGPIFSYAYWEPGYSQVRYIRISNDGSLPFKFKVTVTADGATSDLGKVIDVYCAPVSDDLDVANMPSIGTLDSLMTDANGAAYGNMVPAGKTAAEYGLTDAEVGEVIYCVKLTMNEDAGNEYQGKTLGENGFSVKVEATQLNAQ